MKKLTKKLSTKTKILLGKIKENSMKLTLDKKTNKELWKILESMGLQSKAAIASTIFLKGKNESGFNVTKS